MRAEGSLWDGPAFELLVEAALRHLADPRPEGDDGSSSTVSARCR